MSDQETQIGQSKTYNIAGRSLSLKPLALGKMKKATMIFSQKDKDSVELLAEYLLCIFDNGENDGLTKDWINDNVTMVMAQQIIDDSRKMNGLGGFFPKGPAPAEQPKVERPLEETAPTPSV